MSLKTLALVDAIIGAAFLWAGANIAASVMFVIAIVCAVVADE